MPSASAKVERIASSEAADPVKQIVNMLEKRMRNLEKRKMKLDNYRLDVKNGKELNEDQKMAVSKYDQVESVLEFTRELSKAMSSIVGECYRQQKKLAKKEQLERQQHEIQRLQEAFIYGHILSCFQNQDVRSDFLNGENGAVQISSEQLSQLDQLYKLIGPGLPSEQAEVTNHFHTLAENHIFLVEGKNKEIVGTTYKVLKDLLQCIKDSGYFSKPSESIDEDAPSSEGIPEFDVVPSTEEQSHDETSNADIGEEQMGNDNYGDEEEEDIEEDDKTIVSISAEQGISNEVLDTQNGPLQEVLSAQTTFDFLQESQIDLDAPHMDPAVVAVHQMAPPPAVKYDGTTYPASTPIDAKPLTNGIDTCDVSNPTTVINQIPAAVPGTVTSVLPSLPLNSQQEFDPSHPIPTQTFTNQNFAVMQNMMLPQAYVPVTVHHAPIAPIAVVPGLSTPVTTGTSLMPVPVTVAAVAESEVEQSTCDTNGQISDDNSHETQVVSYNGHEKNIENGPSWRGNGYRRGRGRSNNNYYRGRQNYNGRGGGYNNHYYQDRNGYNGNYRRGNNNRGGPRGTGGNNRGRGNYRTQQGQNTPNHQHQQQQQTTQQ